MPKKSRAGEVVDAIIEDLTDRKHLGDSWSEMEGRERDETRASWLRIVEEEYGEDDDDEEDDDDDDDDDDDEEI